eukprot:4075726-Amphidinium_carterae.1
MAPTGVILSCKSSTPAAVQLSLAAFMHDVPQLTLWTCPQCTRRLALSHGYDLILRLQCNTTPVARAPACGNNPCCFSILVSLGTAMQIQHSEHVFMFVSELRSLSLARVDSDDFSDVSFCTRGPDPSLALEPDHASTPLDSQKAIKQRQTYTYSAASCKVARTHDIPVKTSSQYIDKLVRSPETRLDIRHDTSLIILESM